MDQTLEFGGGLGARLLGWLAEEFLYDRPPSPDAGSSDKDSITLASETIVVTGDRPGEDYDPYTDGSAGSGGSSIDDGTGEASITDGSEAEPPPCVCAGMTEAEKLEQAIDAEVADVLEEILARADQNMEYGSLIWIDQYGVVQHTPLIPSPDYRARIDISALPLTVHGTPDWSVVVAMVHSHPRYLPRADGSLQDYYRPDDQDYLLYPSQTHVRDGTTQGDWIVFDQYATNIGNSGGDVATFDQYIIGFDGDGLAINEFGSEDRETNTVASGEAVDPNLEACTCSF